MWVSPEPSPEVVAELSRAFSEVVVIPDEVLQGEVAGWAATGIVVRSLAHWISVDTVIREVRQRAALAGELSEVYLDNGIFLLRCASAEDRDLVLTRPWVIAGRALALEAWRPGFFPVAGAVRSALVWVRLPHLPAEYWSREAMVVVLHPAGELLSVDEWSASRKRMTFARACVRIELTAALRPGVLIQGPEGPFWQRFVYEGVDSVCLRCGRFHWGSCTAAEGAAVGDGGGSDAHVAPPGGVRPAVFGPWMLASRQWRTGPPAVPVGRAQGLPASPSPSRRPGKEPVGGSSEDWFTPSKVARRSSPRRQGGRTVEGYTRGSGVVEGEAGGSRFAPLSQPWEEVDRSVDRAATRGLREQGQKGAGPRASRPQAAEPQALGPVRGGLSAVGLGEGGPCQSSSKRARPTDVELGQTGGSFSKGSSSKGCSARVSGLAPKAISREASRKGRGATRTAMLGVRVEGPGMELGRQDPDLSTPAGSVEGVFHFGTGRGSGGSSCPPVQDLPSHEEAVRRLSDVLQAPEDPPRVGLDPAITTDMEESSGGGEESGSSPPIIMDQ